MWPRGLSYQPGLGGFLRGWPGLGLSLESRWAMVKGWIFIVGHGQESFI